MAYFKQLTFGGTAPAMSPRLLPEQLGQTAQNIDFESGRFTPIKQDTDAFTLASTGKKSIFLYQKPLYVDAWDNSKTYVTGNLVKHSNNIWKAVQGNSNQTPSGANSANWVDLGTTADQWFQWDEANIDAHQGPIVNDTLGRLYWTGEDYPRISNYPIAIQDATGPYPEASNGSYRLGVPAPASAPTLSKIAPTTWDTGQNYTQHKLVKRLQNEVTTVYRAKSSHTSASANEPPNDTFWTDLGQEGDQTPNDVAYVFTFVSNFNEEGPPSPASSVIQLVDNEDVTVTLPYGAADSLFTGYNISTSGGAKVRIYRSNTGSTNTTFQFAGEITFGTSTFTDYNTALTLQEVLPSTGWIHPPNDDTALYPTGPLQQLTPLPNGMFAGFTGKRFCVSEPFLPHAWPIQYRITIERTIVAIAASRNGIVALTDAKPYFITGQNPTAMTSTSVDLAQACINKDSVVDMGETVMYAGPDGLCAVENAQGSVLTEGQISVEQWNSSTGAFRPTIIKAFRSENTYVAFWESGGNYGGWVYDPRAGLNALSTLSVTGEVAGGHFDERDNQLYLIVSNKIKKYRGSASSTTATFKSKQFVTPTPVSMSWVSVHAEGYPVTVKVTADGTEIANYSISYSADVYTQTTTTPSSIPTASLREPIMRLPAVIAQAWEVEVSSAFEINDFCLSQSIDEIKAT